MEDCSFRERWVVLGMLVFWFVLCVGMCRVSVCVRVVCVYGWKKFYFVGALYYIDKDLNGK